MTGSVLFFFVFITVLAFILLGISVLLSPHTPYSEKNSSFECGYSSFRGQNRTEFSVSFFIFGLLFLILDLEILLVYPYTVSSYNNGAYGLFFVIVFLLILTVGFAYELGRNALKINSRQTGYLNAPYLEGKGLLGINLYQPSSLSFPPLPPLEWGGGGIRKGFIRQDHEA
jgi:NADH-ubiquinone oxidoreductase chain 3